MQWQSTHYLSENGSTRLVQAGKHTNQLYKLHFIKASSILWQFQNDYSIIPAGIKNFHFYSNLLIFDI